MNELTKMYRVTQEHDEGETTIKFNEYPVVSENPATVIITDHLGKPRRVTKDIEARQPYAHVSKEAALRAFFYRKKRHLAILRFQCRLVAQLKKTARIMLSEADEYQQPVFDVTIHHSALDSFKDLMDL